MKEISIDQVKDGDILARELRAPNGAVILSAGSALSLSMIARLKKMSIQLICIRGDGSEGDSEAAARQLELLEQRFAGTELNPILQELKTIVADHIRRTG